MRISLGTRVFLAYLLVWGLLAGVAVYSLGSMESMRREVVQLRSEVFPAWGRLQRLVRDTSGAVGVLQKGTVQEVWWLAHSLGSWRPYKALEGIAENLRNLQDGEGLDPLALSRFGALSTDVERLLEEGWEEAEALNQTLVAFRNSLATGVSLEAWREGSLRSELQIQLESLRDQLVPLEAAFDTAVDGVWSQVEDREGRAFRVALVLGGVALLVAVATAFLLVAWFRPLGRLRSFAQKVSVGDYNQPLEVRGSDEILDLAADLKSMAQRLKEREEMIKNQAKELVKADRFSTIGKMSTQIAHEIRNPLNAMGLKLELLEELMEEGEQDDERKAMRSAVVAINKEIDRLREITDYYLKFAKFPRVEKEWVDISVVLTDIVTFYSEEARRKSIEVEMQLERPMRVHVDPNLIRHAVANLLKNAIEALHGQERGARTISVRSWRDGAGIRLQIRDTGPGIPAEVVAHVFEPFFSTKKTGTGLGLTLVQQVLQEHAGEVRVTSEPGGGTTFVMWIPD